MNDSAIVVVVESVRTRASTGEALLTLAIPLEQAALISTFLSKIGHQVGAAFADIEKAVIPSKPQPLYGAESKALWLSGFILHREVWQALGSDDAYLDWIRRQPSAHSDEFSEYDEQGDGRCEASHVRRVEAGSGTALKPAYSAIPLTHAEHQLTHQKGESALREPKWFEYHRDKYIAMWAWEMLRSHMNVLSMAEADPKEVYQWANFHGVEKFLPKEYCDAALSDR